MEVFFLCKTSSRPFRLCSFCAFDFPFRGNFFGSFASWVFFFFFCPPFRWAGEEGGGSGVHLVFLWGASSPPARLWSGERGGSASGHLSVACGLAPSSPPPSGGWGRGSWLSCCRRPFPASPRLLTLPNSHRTFHDVGIWGSLQSLAPAFYPPASPALRSVARGWIRGLGPVRLALVDVAVALALSPLTVRGLAVVSVGDGRRPLHALLVDAHAVSGRVLLTAAALSVGALGRVVPGLDPRIDIGHAVTSLGVRGRGLLAAAAPTVSVRVSLPVGGCGAFVRDRTLSHIARLTARGHACDSLLLLPACGPWKQAGWPDVGHRRVWGPLSLSLLWPGAAAGVPPVLEGRPLPLSRLFFPGACQVRLELVWLLFPGSIWSLGGCDRFCSSVVGYRVSRFGCCWGGHFVCCDCDACWGWRFLPAAPAAVPGVSGDQQRQGVSRSRGRRSRSSGDGTDRRASSAPGEGLLLLPALRVVGGEALSLFHRFVCG